MKQRIIASLLAMCLVVGLLPTVALAAGEDDNTASQSVQELYIGKTALVSNGTPTQNTVANAVYDAGSNTLTLSGVTVTDGHAYTGTTTAGIYASGDLNLVLTGTNTIGTDSYDLSHGVSVAGNLTISGDGSLTAYGSSNGIVAGDAYSLTITSGQINAYGGKTGLRGGKDLVIDGGTITAQGGMKTSNNFGLLANSGVLKINEGTVNASNVNTSGGYGMKGTTGVEIYGGTVTASGTTYDIYTTKQIYVFGGSVAADNCSPSCTYMSGNCGATDSDSVTWKLEQNNRDDDNPTYTLTISGTGAMADFTTKDVKNQIADTRPWKDSLARIVKIVVENNVTYIGENAFNGCANCTHISVGTGVIEIAKRAFSFIGSAETPYTINFNNTTSLKEIDHSFRDSTGLKEITIPASVTTIGVRTFRECKNLTTVSFEKDSQLKTIGDQAFYLAPALTSLDFTNTKLQTIGEGAFSGAASLKTVFMPDTVTSIGKQAFNKCTSLTAIRIPSNITTIKQETFFQCTALTNVVVPANVTILEKGAFQRNSQMHSVDLASASSKIIITKGGNNYVFGGLASNNIVYISRADFAEKLETTSHAIAVTNGGTFADDTSFASNTLSAPGKDDFDFAGWYTDSDFSTEAPKDGDVYTATAGPIYYAKWNSEITFDANGGTGSMEAQTIAETDTSTKLTKNTFAREGYEFSGWNTAADGSGTSYTDEATEAGANGNITLYAQWTKKIGESTNYTVNAILDQTYTGAAIEPAVVVKNGDTVLDSGYTVAYSNNTDVGTAKATVAVGSDTAEVKFKIVKDTSPTVEMADVSVTYGTEYAMTATAKTSAGNEITGGTITIKYYTDENCTTGETDTAPTSAGTYYAKATLTGTGNYAVATKTAKITISNATFSVSATGYDGTYDGRAHSITVEADDDVTVTYCKTENGDYTSEKPEYTDAGEYTVYYKASKANHNEVTGSATVKIAKVQTSLTLTADPASRTGAGTVKLTVSSTGIPETETIAAPTCEGVTVAANSDGTYSVSLLNETKEYTFAVSYAGDGNHEAAEATCTVSVTRRSSGGGGSSSGGSSSSNTTTETVTNKDGSTTTTVTDKTTGTVTETTKYKDGSTLVVETKKDGTVTTTETRADGVEVKTVDEPGENMTAAVTIPKSVGTATVTIPADVDYGMVAVDAETGEIVKLSVPTEDGMTVKLDGSAELVLVDNAKDFDDTANHWATDAIDFATAHEMFAGTSATTFSPDSSMTRAMLMTVLARFDGQDTSVESGNWYDKAMTWAKENGVSDGSNPNSSITREQLATMLYRYVGSPAVSGSLDRFSDAASVSGYATDAMEWAVSSGLIGGMGDGTLNPQGSATRAQVATILMRYVENLTK